MKRLNLSILSTLLVALTLTTANASGEHTPPNTLAVGLDGYSPVSYFEQDEPHFGSPEFRAEHDGVTYFFASQDEVDTFTADPQRYAPAYGGWCAYGMAVEGVFGADPTNYKIIDDRLNVFLRNDEVDTLDLWNDGDEATLRSQADAYWTQIAAE